MRRASPCPSPARPVPADFSALSLSAALIQAVTDLGFIAPTPIQSLAVPRILAGVDFVGQACTGTGKTLAFGLPILEKLRDMPLSTRSGGRIRALVLCPTRELAIQVAEDLRALAAHLAEVGILPVYGGQPLERQSRALSRGSLIVAGTPGRVLDHLKRGSLILEDLSFLVLDEADEMLDMGFREDMERILKAAPARCQKICFSATLPPPIVRFVRACLRDPEFVRIPQEVIPPGIEQRYFEVRQDRKFEALTLLMDTLDLHRGIIFRSTRLGADDLAARLESAGQRVEALHGDLPQPRRDRVMRLFREGAFEFLIATDVAARGLDIDAVEVIINFDLPLGADSYIHRIGRTGRAGKPGKALSLVAPHERIRLREILRRSGVEIRKTALPDRREVKERQAGNLLKEVRSRWEAVSAQNLAKMEPHELLISSLPGAEESPLRLAALLFTMLLERNKKSTSEVP